MEKLISQQRVKIVGRKERLWCSETGGDRNRGQKWGQEIMRAWIREVTIGMESRDEVTEILQRWK